MTIEELKKEAEEWLCNNLHSANEEDFIKAMVDIAEPREKRIADLESKLNIANINIENFLGQITVFAKENVKLEKENAELKENNEKWFVFETEAGNWGMDKATQYTVDRHNYFYGTKEECQKWAVEHKIKDYTGHKYCYDRLEEQLTNAKEIISEFVEWANWQGNSKCPSFKSIQDKAEQFLKDCEVK